MRSGVTSEGSPISDPIKSSENRYLSRRVREVIVESRFFPLFATLVVFVFLVYPLTVSYGRPGLLLNVFAVSTVLVSLRTVAGGHRMLPTLLTLSVPMFATRIWSYADDNPNILVAYLCFSGLFQIAVGMVCLSRVLDNSPVSTDKIIGAICVYLLIGVVFTHIYEIIYILDPDSFDLGSVYAGNAREPLELMVFFYFSFVTLTTLGYGDMLPLTAFTRSISTLEAIIGPLYLAILVARLVSLRDAKPEIES